MCPGRKQSRSWLLLSRLSPFEWEKNGCMGRTVLPLGRNVAMSLPVMFRFIFAAHLLTHLWQILLRCFLVGVRQPWMVWEALGTLDHSFVLEQRALAREVT